MSVDAGRRRWLELLTAACDAVLAGDAGTRDPYRRLVVQDVGALREQLRAELESPSGCARSTGGVA